MIYFVASLILFWLFWRKKYVILLAFTVYSSIIQALEPFIRLVNLVISSIKGEEKEPEPEPDFIWTFIWTLVESARVPFQNLFGFCWGRLEASGRLCFALVRVVVLIVVASRMMKSNKSKNSEADISVESIPTENPDLNDKEPRSSDPINPDDGQDLQDTKTRSRLDVDATGAAAEGSDFTTAILIESIEQAVDPDLTPEERGLLMALPVDTKRDMLGFLDRNDDVGWDDIQHFISEMPSQVEVLE